MMATEWFVVCALVSGVVGVWIGGFLGGFRGRDAERERVISVIHSALMLRESLELRELLHVFAGGNTVHEMNTRLRAANARESSDAQT